MKQCDWDRMWDEMDTEADPAKRLRLYASYLRRGGVVSRSRAIIVSILDGAAEKLGSDSRDSGGEGGR